jgi:hypothetical protein
VAAFAKLQAISYACGLTNLILKLVKNVRKKMLQCVIISSLSSVESCVHAWNHADAGAVS